MKKISVALIILFVLGICGCDKTDKTEAKVKELLSQKRELSGQIMDINSQIQKLVAEKKAADNDEKAVNDFFHPKPKAPKAPVATATSTGVTK